MTQILCATAGEWRDCPFCKGEFSVAKLTEPFQGMPVGMPFVNHTEPTCKKFDELDVLEFLQAVNTAMGNYDA